MKLGNPSRCRALVSEKLEFEELAVYSVPWTTTCRLETGFEDIIDSAE